MVAELTYAYNGITLGGDEYPVLSTTGLEETPDVRVEQVDVPIGHGSYTYGEYLGPRSIGFTGFIIKDTPAALQAAVDILRGGFPPMRIDEPLTYRLAGWSIDKRAYCKVDKGVSIDMNTDYTLGYAEWSLRLLAGDPRLYEDTEQTASGIGTVVVDNTGNFPTNPWVQWSSATNPSIENQTTGESMSFTGTGQWTIDFSAKTVKLGGVSRYDLMDPASVWFDLEPGANSLLVAGGSAEVRWRSAWL